MPSFKIFRFSIFFGFLICALQVLGSDKINIQKYKLALNWKAEPQFGGFYAGVFNQHFKQNGFDIDILQGGAGTPTLQMLIAGQVDFAIISADELILAHERGQTDVAAFFAVYQTNPQAIMARDSVAAQSISELLANKNLQLLWQAGLPYALFLKKKFNVQVKTAPYTGGISNILQDEKIIQQCFLTSEPILAEQAGLKVKTFLVADAGYNPYTTVVVAKKKWLEAHKAERIRLQQSLKNSWLDYINKPEPINLEMSKLNKAMSLEIFAKSAKAQKPLILSQTSKIGANMIGQMQLSRWQELIQQIKEIGLVKKEISAQSLFFSVPE